MLCALKPFVAALTTMIVLLVAQHAGAQDVSREDAIKAAYLYNFGRYVDWPTSAFSAENSPLVIGIVGPSLVDQHLMAYTKDDKQVRGRPIRIQRWTDAAKFEACHILLISAQLDARQRDLVVKATTGKPVLLVSEGAESILAAGGIHFMVQQNRMKIQIAANQVRARGLKISSKLLQVAEVIE
jgi:hypothetical protein